ncbi:MAG: hypothetical protein ACK5MN_02430 [Lachnospiraceae bacterium]
MKKIKNRLAALLVIGVLAVTLTACSSIGQELDVIGKGAKESFAEIVTNAENLVSQEDAYDGWALESPDGSARFIWSGDWSASGSVDALLELDAQPFIDAGLEVEKLPESIIYADSMLRIGIDLGESSPEGSDGSTAVAAFEQIVDARRDLIGYHSALGHFGVTIGDGNAIEWAQDMQDNDKDLVFALNPQPFIDAGVDVEAIEGWTFAQVSMHMDGKDVQVDKLLKPSDLG